MISGVERLDITKPDVQNFIIEACATSRVAKKDLGHNYTRENFQRQFAENRFDEGFFLVRHEGVPFSLFGLSKFKNNWLVITRLIHLQTLRQNVVWGTGGMYFLPFLDQEYSNKYVGVFFCTNGARNIITVMVGHRSRQQKINPHPLDSYSLLPYTVMHRGVEQTVLYKTFNQTAEVPPLDKYKDLEWNLRQEKV